MLPVLIGIACAIGLGLAFILGRTLPVLPRNKLPDELRKYDFATASRDTFGLDVLKAVCLLFCLMSLIVLVPRAHQFSALRLAVLVANDTFSRFVLLLRAILFAAGFYGIHRRLMIAWKAGWLFLALLYLDGLTSTLQSTLRLSSPDRWLASVACVLAMAGFAAYWGRWWRRMKCYFVSPVPLDSSR
jgi:hypothetical protein